MKLLVDDEVEAQGFAATLSQVAGLGNLDSLWLSAGYCEASVQQALCKISCRLFRWTQVSQMIAGPAQLPQASQTVLCYADVPGQVQLDWSAIASRPGCFCILVPGRSRVKIMRAGPKPLFKEPWTLWVRNQGRVQGLPWHNFKQQPSGWWVWANAAALRLGLQEPEGVD